MEADCMDVSELLMPGISSPPQESIALDGVPVSIALQHADMACIAMVRGERDRAVRAIERAFEVAAEQAAEVVTLNSHIDDLFVANVVTALNELGIETVGDLIGFTPQQLAAVRNINWKTIEKIQEALSQHGFQLGTG